MESFWRLCRSVAVGLVVRPWPGETQATLESRLDHAPIRVQVAAVGTVLGLLLAAAFLAAQFGWVGLLVYFVAVIALVG